VWTDADIAAAGVAERQTGAIHRASLVDAGLSEAMIDRRVARQLLVRRADSVYSFAGSPGSPRQDLVVQALSVDVNAAVSHDSAAHSWGMIQRAPRKPHVLVRRWNREHRSACIVHESLDFEQVDRVWTAGVPLTTPARTVVDLGASSPWLVERALSTGLRLELFDVDEVAAFVRRVARRGRSGVGVVRPYLAMHRAAGGRTESFLEDRFVWILHARQIPLPRTQFEVRDDRGRFIGRVDFAYPEHRVLIELDGHSYHSDIETFQRDREKQNRTQELGWRMLRFTWHDVVREPDRTAATVAHWIGLAWPVLA